jgi:hypothetical protein
MKVVINKGFGSFELTNGQFERVLALKGIEFDTILTKFGWIDYLEKGTNNPLQFSIWDMERNDPHLVQVVEESGDCVVDQGIDGLKIVEIPDGISWQIDDYDGNEWVSETHRTWG